MKPRFALFALLLILSGCATREDVARAVRAHLPTAAIVGLTAPSAFEHSRGAARPENIGGTVSVVVPLWPDPVRNVPVPTPAPPRAQPVFAPQEGEAP